MLTIFFYLIVGHAAIDFGLQTDTIAINKNPNAKTELQKQVPWYYWMVAHALMHGGAVLYITTSVWFGLAETVCHFIIDWFKCNHGKYMSIHQDQLLHVLCKVMWALLIYTQV
jgi:hypothetical protein